MRRKLKRSPLLAAAAGLAAVGLALALTPRGPVADSTDVAVFAAILASEAPAPPRAAYVEDETDSSPLKAMLSDRGTPDRAVTPALLASLRARNTRPAAIPSSLARRGVRLVSHAEVKAAFRETWWDELKLRLFGVDTGWWEDFYKRYPDADGITTFSLPGYSQDRASAVVYCAHSSGGLAGEGSLVLLRRVDGTWKVVRRIGLWVS